MKALSKTKKILIHLFFLITIYSLFYFFIPQVKIFHHLSFFKVFHATEHVNAQVLNEGWIEYKRSKGPSPLRPVLGFTYHFNGIEYFGKINSYNMVSATILAEAEKRKNINLWIDRNNPQLFFAGHEILNIDSFMDDILINGLVLFYFGIFIFPYLGTWFNMYSLEDYINKINPPGKKIEEQENLFKKIISILGLFIITGILLWFFYKPLLPKVFTAINIEESGIQVLGKNSWSPLGQMFCKHVSANPAWQRSCEDCSYSLKIDCRWNVNDNESIQSQLANAKSNKSFLKIPEDGIIELRDTEYILRTLQNKKINDQGKIISTPKNLNDPEFPNHYEGQLYIDIHSKGKFEQVKIKMPDGNFILYDTNLHRHN